MSIEDKPRKIENICRSTPCLYSYYFMHFFSELTAHIATTEAKLDAVETLRSDLAARFEELQVQKDTQLDQFVEERDSLSVTVK